MYFMSKEEFDGGRVMSGDEGRLLYIVGRGSRVMAMAWFEGRMRD
jgi:hypothetical protein